MRSVFHGSLSSSSVVQCEDDEFSGNLGADLVEICGVPSDTAVRQKVLLVHLEDTNVRRSKLASGELELHERQEQYRVDEAKALAQSVVSWKVVADISYTVDLNHLNKDHVLHKRNLADLNLFLSRRKDISVVFINIPQMSSVQFANLLKLWSRYIVDRYMMVLTIFRLQASSKEAKLQVARLMISLIKHRMEQNNILPKFLGRGLGNSKSWGRGKTAKGAVTAKEHRKLHIQAIDSKVKEELASLKRERQKNRTRKQLSNMPIISVVGYTNCGKTTLVKSLTRSDKLKPLDKLFATTEVSTHHGELNHGWTCMYNDTVGLISEMPHELVEAFVASFEDILRGHLIVNVTDISHPDWTNQLRVVHETIQSAMSKEEANQIEANDSNGCTNQWLIQVFNKCDKLGDNDKDHILDSYGKIVADFDIARSEPPIFTVATQGAGNAELLERIYEELLLTDPVMSSEVFERCKDDVSTFLNEYQNRTSRRLKGTGPAGLMTNFERDRLLTETENKVQTAYRSLQTMQKEISMAPVEFRTNMNVKLRSLQRDVDSVNRDITLEERQRQQVLYGTDALNRASQSVARTQRVAAENEEIGVEILGELGTQREQLQRTSRKLDETNAELSRSRKILNTMQRRVITNKLLLLGIIGLEVIILLAVIYIKFIK